MNFTRTIKQIISVCTFLSAVSLMIMMLITVADVFMANALQSPIIGTYDLVECALVVTVFLSLPATFLSDKHIMVDIIDFFVSANILKWIKRLSLLVTVAFLTLLAFEMIQPAYDYYRFGEQKPELGVSVWILWVPMILGVGLSVFAVLAAKQNEKAQMPQKEIKQ